MVQEKWRDNEHRIYKDIVINIGNPHTYKGEIFKLHGASHFIYGFVDQENKKIIEWLLITDLTRLVTLVHENPNFFQSKIDKHGKVRIHITIETIKKHNLVVYHYPDDFKSVYEYMTRKI